MCRDGVCACTFSPSAVPQVEHVTSLGSPPNSEMYCCTHSIANLSVNAVPMFVAFAARTSSLARNPKAVPSLVRHKDDGLAQRKRAFNEHRAIGESRVPDLERASVYPLARYCLQEKQMQGGKH